MKNGIKKRILSLVLCISMILPMVAVPMPVHSVESEESIAPITNPFTPETIITLPDGTTTKSQSYRIPSMVTLADGTIVASADIRWNTTYDGGGLDTLVAYSTDNGATWSYTLANYLNDNGNQYNALSSSFIDASLAVGRDGQTIYMLCDLYAGGVALNGNGKQMLPYQESGFTNEGYLKLSYNFSNYTEYLKDGKIYDKDGKEIAGYTVDSYFNLYQNGTYVSNLFFYDSPVAAYPTAYLYLTKSTDGGKTWSEPTLLDLKSSSENACLVSPGDAITTKDGSIVFPVYSYNGSESSQKMGFIYSKDSGVTWQRSANFEGAETFSSEASVIELENGNLRFFYRNKNAVLTYADFDVSNGISNGSWDKEVKTSIPVNSNTQLSAITYSKTSDGKQVVLVSCPTGPDEAAGSTSNDGSNRTNGKIHVFTVDKSGTMEHVKSVKVNDYTATAQLRSSNYTEEQGFFAYSSLTERKDGSIAILYENNQFGWGAGDGKYYTITADAFHPSSLGLTPPVDVDNQYVTILDQNGNTVSSVTMGLYEKIQLQASTLHFSSADVHYQWQIEHENGKWADIYGETGDSLQVTFGLIGNLLDDDGKVGIRCKTTTLLDTVYSQTVNISIAPYEYEEPEEKPEEELKVVVSESVTTSSGKTAVVNIAGDIPEDASVALNEIDPSDVEIAEGEAVALALDITIKNSDGTEWQPESGKKVTVTVGAYQLGLTNGDKVAIYHVHNGEVSILGTFEVVDYLVTFEVDGFSEFIFTVDPDDDYQELIGLYAGFNAVNQWTGEGAFDYFWLKNDPTDPEESNFVWSIYDKDFEIDQIVKVRNYYVDSARSLWIEVEGVNGLELPKSLQEHPWIHMNSLNVYDYTYNTLFFFEPEDLSEEDISVVDQYGLSVWELYIDANHKREITVKANLSGEVKYRWEVCYDTENLLWTEINGETSPSLNLSFGMLSGVLQDGEWALLRCVAYNATESVTSNVIIARVIVPEIMTMDGEPQQVIVVSTAPEVFAFGRLDTSVMMAKSVAPMAEGDKVYVNLIAQKEDGTVILREPYELEYNGTVHRDVTIPYIKGFDLYDQNGNLIPLDTENNVYNYTVDKANVTENLDIVLTYKPGKTTYKVTYYLQNVSNDRYTKYGDSVVLEGITGEMIDVSDPAFSRDFEGFYQLLFETAEIASDGSTEIEVFYDRLYYKMLFNLDGGYGVQPVYARYGTPVTVDNPTKSGYVFSGWDRDNDGKVDIEQFVDIEVPAYHTSYTAIWRASEGAKVTVVIWGQNADDDEYSYVADQSFEIYASTGSTITYAPGQLMCGFEEHTHDARCGAKCGYAEEHTHSVAAGCYKLICGKDEHITHTDACCNAGGVHVHTVGCYQVTGGGAFVPDPVTDLAIIRALDNSSPNGNNVYVREGRYYDTYYAKIADGVYYQIQGSGNSRPGSSTTVTLACTDTSSHTQHSDSCCQYGGLHTHSGACYETDCSKQEHTHEAACYNCPKKEHTHDAACSHTTTYDSDSRWILNADKTGCVTVAADGSTVYNVYYDRREYTFKFVVSSRQVHEFSAKWGSNIVDQWTFTGSNGTNYSPANKDSWKASSGTYTQRIFLLVTMPAENATFNRASGNSYSNVFYYYVESLTQQAGDGRRLYDGKYYDLEFTLNNDFGKLYYDEDFFQLKGFNRYKSAGENGNDYTLSNSGTNPISPLYFYYTRINYQLVFRNYGTDERVESAVPYQAPLSTYGSYKLDDSLAPDVYQEGSVTFKGWYRSPQVPGNFNFAQETPFDFSTATMPDGDLILYAWWEPVKHDVTFYHSYEDMLANKVYTVGDTIYDYDVPHGSHIADPYDPPADPENGRYSFNGWFYVNEKGVETLWSFEDSTVTSDVEIYAKWTSNILMRYTVRFVYKDENGKEIEIAAPITGSALAGNTKTFNAKVGSELKDGYQTKYFPEVQSHSLTIDIDDETKNEYTFYYVYRANVPYTVYYLTKDDPGNSLGKVEYDGQTYYQIHAMKEVPNNENVIVTENAELIGGYVFDEYQKRLTVDPNDPSKNVIYFFYEKDTVNGQYVVHYMTEKADGSGYDEHSTFTGKMVAGSVYDVPNPPKEIENFTFDESNPNNKLSGTIQTSTILELWVYYTRNDYSYTVQYLEETTNKVLTPEKTGKANWEAEVTENAITIPNYTALDPTSVTIVISEEDEENLIIFYYREQTVTLYYKTVGPDGTVDDDGVAAYGKVNPNSETVKISNGNALGSVASATSDAYKFVGWYSDAACTDLVYGGATYVPTKADDALWVDGTTYYAKFEYNLTSLTIDKAFPAGADYSMDVNQSFLFDVVEVDEQGIAVNGGVSMTVTIHGDGAITIDGLTVGHYYMITEKTNWSWRYDECTVSIHEGLDGATGANSARVKLTADASTNKVTFTNTRGNEQWLDGDSWCNNLFQD